MATSSLVVGNMIGAGIYVLPASLGKFGSISILGWLLTAAGSIILASIFSNFSKLLRGKMVVLSILQNSFWRFYWIFSRLGILTSCWVNNAAIAVAIVSALSFFIRTRYQLHFGSFDWFVFIWLFTFTTSKELDHRKYSNFTTIPK